MNCEGKSVVPCTCIGDRKSAASNSKKGARKMKDRKLEDRAKGDQIWGEVRKWKMEIEDISVWISPTSS